MRHVNISSAYGLLTALAMLLLAGCTPEPARGEDGQVLEPADIGVYDVREGDCFDDDPEAGEVILSLRVVPCSGSHDNEIYAILLHPAAQDAPYPGDDAVYDAGLEACYDAFRGFVGVAYEQSALDFSVVYPTEDGWDRLGDREFVCYLYDYFLAPLTGSMRDSRR